MATPGSTTQPQQVSQACIPLAAAAHGDEAWDVPGKDGTAAITQAPTLSIPPKSFSIHSNSANPIHSEIPFRPSHLHSTLNNTADQHPSMETNQSMSDHPLTPSQPHSILGNPGDQSMSSPQQQYPQSHGFICGWDNFNFPIPNGFDNNSVEPSAEIYNSFSLSDLDLPEGFDTVESGVDATSNPFPLTDPPESIASSYLAADTAAAGEIGQALSGSLEGDPTTPAGALHVDVGDELSPGHGSHVHMDGDQSLAHMRFCNDTSTATDGAVLKAGSMEDGSVGRPRLVPVGVGHRASSSATGPDCLRLKSAQGFVQPDTGSDEVGNPGPSTRITMLERCLDQPGDLFKKEKEPCEYRRRLDSLVKEDYLQEDVDVIRDVLRFHDNNLNRRRMRDVLSLKNFTDDYCFVGPQQEPPLSEGHYITRFAARLEECIPEAGGYWKEKECKAIRDPSARKNIIGLKRLLEYMNGNKRKRLLAVEYVAVESSEYEARIRGEIAVRRVYELGGERAPQSKCSKNCPHCHSSSGESYIWSHMTKIFVKGEAGSETAPSLLYGICHECDKALKCPQKSGTSNLNKHLGNDHGILPPCKRQRVMTRGKGVVGASPLRV